LSFLFPKNLLPIFILLVTSLELQFMKEYLNQPKSVIIICIIINKMIH